MIVGQEMEISLGLPVIIEGFKDNQPRFCYPFTLSNLTMANLYLSNFDHNDIYKNWKDETGLCNQAMVCFFKMAFRPKNDNETNDLLSAIDGDNFSEIVADIKNISGIKDIDKDGNSPYKDSNGESVSWATMVNIIPLYTSTPHSEVKNMTLPQLNRTLELIQKKINWEYKISTISLAKKPSEHIEKSDSLFYEEPKRGDKKVTTMKEIMGML